jgi:hypothetical protein
MPYDDTQDDDTQEDDDQTNSDDQSDDEADDSDDGERAVSNASPDEVDAHRALLDKALTVLQSRGVDTSELISDAGAVTDDVSQMSHGDLASTTLALAQLHPELLQELSQQFPDAQGILGAVLQSGGGGLSGILSRFL